MMPAAFHTGLSLTGAYPPPLQAASTGHASCPELQGILTRPETPHDWPRATSLPTQHEGCLL